MLTLLCKLKCARRHRTVQIITKINFEISSGDVLLQSCPVLLTNQFKNNATIFPVQKEKIIERYEIHKKFTLLKKEFQRYGSVPESRIIQILNDIKKFGSVTSLEGLLLLQYCRDLTVDVSPKLKLKLVNDIWITLKSLGVPLDASHYNAFLYACNDSEQEFSPIEFFEEMMDSNVKPNSLTFQRFIWQFCNQGKVEEANLVLKYMTEDKVPVNGSILSYFVYGYAVNNDVVGVQRTLKSLEEFDIEPTITTYSILMYAYAKMGDINNVRKILQDCIDKDIWVTDKVFLNIVYNLVLSDSEEYIDEILSLTSKGKNYTKDAIAIIYKLLDKQQIDAAFKIFYSIPNMRNYTIDHFIQTLLKYQIPIEKTVEFCQIVNDRGINHRTFLSTITHDMQQSNIALMKAWIKIGGSINMGFFYHILKLYGETSQSNVIINILQKIGPQLSISELLSYSLPYMEGSMKDKLISLSKISVKYSNALNAILIDSLSKNNIQEAVYFMKINHPSYKLPLIKYSLLHALRHSEDVPSFVWIVHFLYESELNKLTFGQTIPDIDKKYMSQQFIDSCVLEAVNILSEKNKYLMIMLFKMLVAKGLNLSPETVLEVEKLINSEIKLEVMPDLKVLKSGKLILYRTNYLQHYQSMNISSHVFFVNDSNRALKSKQRLLIDYCQKKNVDEATKLIQAIENENVDFHTSLCCYTCFIEMYLNLQDINQAESIVKKCMAKSETFQMHKWLTLKLAIAFVENGQFEKAQEYLQMPTIEMMPYNNSMCKLLLNAVVNYRDEKLLYQFHDLLQDYGYTVDTDVLSEALMRLHILRCDGKAALTIAGQITQKRKKLSMHLLRMLVNAEDPEFLNQGLDIYIKMYGEPMTYFRLALCYLEKNNLDQCREIIKDHCQDTISKHAIMKFVYDYDRHHEVVYLERLLCVLDSLNFHIDELCVVLLIKYSMKNEREKMINLWENMIDKNPSKNLQCTLKYIFYEIYSNLQRIIEDSDNAEDRSLLDSMPLMFKSYTYSLICERYSRVNQFSEVVTLWRELKEKYNRHLDIPSGQNILEQMVFNNDLYHIEMIGEFLTRDEKHRFNFDYYLSQVHLKAGSWNLYIKKLELELENKDTTTLRLHYRTIFDSLKEHPEFLEQIESLANKFFEKNNDELMTVCWIYYFLKKDKKADEILTNYFQNLSCFPWSKILDEFWDEFDKDVEFYPKLAELLQMCNTYEFTKLSSYSRMLRNCISSDDPQKYENTVKCMEYALLDFSMEKFDSTLLTKIQNKFEASGKVWPWPYKDNKPSTET